MVPAGTSSGGTASKWLAAVLAAAAMLALALAVPAAEQAGAAPDFRWQGSVEAGRTVTVRGVSGSITAARGSGEVVVEAVKTARRSDPDDVTIEVVEDSEGVLVCAVYPSGWLRQNRCARGDAYRMSSRNNDVNVAFTVSVPDGVHLDARNTNGVVRVSGLSGDVSATTVNGNIEAESAGRVSARTVNGRIDAAMGASPREDLSFRTVNGRVRLALPAEVDADLSLRTVNGGIDSDFPVDVRGRWGPRSASGRLGQGGPDIDVSTVNGGIEVRRR